MVAMGFPEKEQISDEHGWAEQTAKRVAAGLLKIAVDFGLLRGSSAKEFVSFHLPERSFPKYSPPATWIASPPSAFSRA